EYIEHAPSDEKITSTPKGTDQYLVNVNYTEIDHSKTRLIQRTKKEAGIEFYIENDKTRVRMPSNEKAKQIVDSLKTKLEAKKKSQIKAIQIDLSEFNSAESRTRFFTSLITKLKDFTL